ncbi:DeoR/GlpR family DNA-binding transcription regulator [Paraburkholderia bannensis]|uniref:DeoR/GlpR family DNA-binding transcription regulator n=1 Tax=Paraburkholderia bannensis TaxID=765414 RepID=UPI002AC3117F|nr:DeoR/GlpR family DNA-binding transcription regulator [Paraburkholderia bannensis]
METVLPLARRDAIANQLASGQSVNSTALAIEHNVSEDAIRRDLRALAAQGLCRRVYGGALPIQSQAATMASRIGVDFARKTELARKAASTILPRELVFLDTGSSNLALVEFLPLEFDLRIATNCIAIAAAVLQRPGLRLFLVGGGVNPAIGGSVDANASQSVAQLNIDRSFVGCCSVSGRTGVCVLDDADANFKRTLLQFSRTSVTLVLNEKLATHSPFRVAQVDAFDLLVVEHDVANAVQRELRAAGATLLNAKSANSPEAS